MHKHRRFCSSAHKVGITVKNKLRHYGLKSNPLNNRDVMCKRAANLLGLDITMYRHKRLCAKLNIDNWM